MIVHELYEMSCRDSIPESFFYFIIKIEMYIISYCVHPKQELYFNVQQGRVDCKLFGKN